jgi:hypothetical protein
VVHALDMDNAIYTITIDTLSYDDDGARECRGHETTNGPIGSTVYCDGSCRDTDDPRHPGHPVTCQRRCCRD